MFHLRSRIRGTHFNTPGRLRFFGSLDSEKQEILGFVGLGNMGLNMAKNLVKSGKHVIGYDADASKVDELIAAGGKGSATNLEDLAKTCTTVITMLPNTQHVEAVYTGKTGLLRNARPGSLFIDSSTIDPIASQKLSALAETAGCFMVDAPVSGGVPAATSGSLTFIVGGDTVAVSRAEPLLRGMGKNVVHVGPAGTGCVAKLCNNLVLAISMIGVAEGMNLGVSMGMDPKVLAHVLNTSTARCWSSDTYNPYPGVMENVPASRGYTGGFTATLMEKDLHLALQAGRATETSLPMGSLAHQLYTMMKAQGGAKKDFSGILELLAGKGPADSSKKS